MKNCDTTPKFRSICIMTLFRKSKIIEKHWKIFHFRDYNSAIKSCCKSGSAENCDWYSLSKKTGSTCQKIVSFIEKFPLFVLFRPIIWKEQTSGRELIRTLYITTVILMALLRKGQQYITPISSLDATHLRLLAIIY